MVQMHDNIVGIDSAIFMHPKIWKASGHVDGFSDPMIDNKVTQKRYRADQLLEDKIAAYDEAGQTDQAELLEVEMDKALWPKTCPACAS
jgi:glycyl-tRNA synthetase